MEMPLSYIGATLAILSLTALIYLFWKYKELLFPKEEIKISGERKEEEKLRINPKPIHEEPTEPLPIETFGGFMIERERRIHNKGKKESPSHVEEGKNETKTEKEENEENSLENVGKMTLYEYIEKHPHHREGFIKLGVKAVGNRIILNSFGKRITMNDVAMSLNMRLEDLLKELENMSEEEK